MANKLNLVIDAGSDFNTSVQILDDSEGLFDFTGYTARSQIRKHHTSIAFWQFTTSLANGEITLALNNANTSSIPEGRYYYDIELVKTSSNTVTRILEGIVTVTGEVTR